MTLASSISPMKLRDFEDNDALNLEVLDFLRAIKQKDKPLVTGEDGYRALETATQITSLIKASI